MLDIFLMVACGGGLFLWAKTVLLRPRRGAKGGDTFLFWIVIFLVIALYGL